MNTVPEVHSARKSGLLWLRAWRLSALAGLALLTGWQARRLEQHLRPESVTIEEARLLFPAAAALSPAAADGSHAVYSTDGSAAGSVLRTSPRADHIIGYSGPNDVLIGLDPQGTVLGIRLLHSGDTPEHIAMVEARPEFLKSFAGWNPQTPLPGIATVSGATLTSSAIAEAVRVRLSGGAPSLRFPDPVTLDEARVLFPAAAAMEDTGSGRWRVTGADGTVLGFVVRTAPAADNVSGYRGPTESLTALAPDNLTITGVKLRRSYDTESYVQQIREDEWYLNSFRGRTTDQVATMDFSMEKIEGVSGATLTSWAVAEGMKRKFAEPAAAHAAKWTPQTRDWLAAAVVAGALIMAFTGLRGVRGMRLAWQALIMLWALWTGGDLLSLALLAGWAEHGIPWAAAPGAALIAATALLVPWAGRRQIYCHQICPHGAAQQWLGKLRRRKTAVPRRLDGSLRILPWALLASVPLMIFCRRDLSVMEPFDAWVWRAAAVIPLIIAGAGLAASLFIPQAYCRYGCPTGALLSLVRTSGSNDRFGRRDWAFCLLLATAAAGTMSTCLLPATPSGNKHMTVRGHAMGTTWEVTLRDSRTNEESLRREIAALVEKLEADLSHWRPESPVSQFNSSRTTESVLMPESVCTLTKTAAGISEASNGAFDITAGPLVRLWGFGQGARAEAAPDPSQIEAVRAHTGWQRLEVQERELKKSDPLTEIDLSALGEGQATDAVATWLRSMGSEEFLVNIGGELRASGTWPIAIEHPLRTVVLRDAALATSGTYRQNRDVGGHRVSHLIDARTGSPVTHRTVSVSVRHDSAVTADGWATALNVLGKEEGLPLAERLGLAAEFVETDENGEPVLTATSAWRSR